MKKQKNKKTFLKKVLTLFTKNDIIEVEKRKVVFKMENLKSLQKKVYSQKFTVSNDKIKQTERNQLKTDTLDALALDFEQGLQVVGRCKEGVIVAFDNEMEGSIYGVVDIVIKDLSYNPDEYITEYQKALDERAERERKQAEKRKAKA